MTDDRESFRTRIRASLARVVVPNAPAWEDRGHIPAQGWRALAAEGLLGLDLTGPGFRRSAVFLEELGATGYAGVRAAVAVHAYMAASYVDMYGTLEQRERYLAAARRGERVGALAISERTAGSDLRNIATTAEPAEDGGYLVDGDKYYVANGAQADFYIVLARTRRVAAARGLAGASLVIVDADSPGVCREPQPMLGWHAAGVCRVGLRRVAVPPGRLIGRQDRALTQLMPALDFERLVAGLLAVGGVRYCLELLNRFVREHRVGAGPLSANQVVRHRVADLGAEFELVRRFADHATDLHCRGQLDTRDASILKVRATDLAVAAATTAMQYHGARGYLDGSDVARLHRDAVAGTIAGGANEILRDMIFETTWSDPAEH